MSFEVIVARSDAELKVCFAIRRSVFIEEQGVPASEEMDALDARATHFLLREGGRGLGTARLLRSEDSAKIGRVAILPPLRGRGLGRLLMEAVLGEARRLGLAEARLNAQIGALPFYERLGFVAEGEEFLEADIPHRAMGRPLAAGTATPPDGPGPPDSGTPDVGNLPNVPDPGGNPPGRQ